MTQKNKTYVASVLKEVSEASRLKFKALGNDYYAMLDDFDVLSTFLVWHNKEKNLFSIIYASIISSYPAKISMVAEKLQLIEDILNCKGYVYDYPISVIKDVEKWFMHNADGITELEVKTMIPNEILSYYLEWNGIVGYTATINAIFQARKS